MKSKTNNIESIFKNIGKDLDPAQNSTSVAYNPREILVFKCLDLRDSVLFEMSKYYEYTGAGVLAPTHVISAKLKTLFMYLFAQLKRWLPKKEFDELKSQVSSDDFEELEQAFMTLSDLLDKKQITKIDTKVHSTSQFAEGRNRHHGYL